MPSFNQVRRIHIKTGGQTSKTIASVINSDGENTLSILADDLCCELALGEKVRFEVHQPGDALYLYEGKVSEAVKSKRTAYTLKDVCKVHRVERREFVRIPTIVDVHYSVLFSNRDAVEGLIQNISGAGIFLAVKDPLTLNDELLLKFELDYEESSLPVRELGQVVREDNAIDPHGGERWPYRYGVAFKGISMKLQDKIVGHVISRTNAAIL